MRRPHVTVGGERSFWIGLVLGLPFTVVALHGVLGGDEVHLGSWGRWVVTGALVHDLLLVPVVLAVGTALHRALPPAAWVPVRWVLLTVGSLLLVSFPFVRRYGVAPDNPSILPRDYAAGVAAYCAVVVAAGVGWALLLRRRDRRAVTPRSGSPPPTPS